MIRAVPLLLLAGCALDTVVAGPADLEDYRAFRVAAAEGTRLGRAQHYLDRHPDGAFVHEVRTAFDEEEPRWFAEAQGSREGVRRYLVDLPRGPHVAAAESLLLAYSSSMREAELADLARRARFDDAKLETAAAQRRAVGEAILGSLGPLLEAETYGVPRGESRIRTLLARGTWGGPAEHREQEYIFLLPTRPARSSRVLTLETTAIERRGVVTGARLAGEDMFVRWAEADKIVALDPAAPADRTEAQIHVTSRLEGALERRFPASSCTDLRAGRELYHRACDGWEATVTAGETAGTKDTIEILSPRGRTPSPPLPGGAPSRR